MIIVFRISVAHTDNRFYEFQWCESESKNIGWWTSSGAPKMFYYIGVLSECA